MDLQNIENSIRDGLANTSSAVTAPIPNTGFALNTLVVMFNGEIKPIHTLVTGDTLMGDDNTPRSIVSTTRTPCSSFHRIKQNKGTSYILNENNFISVKLSRVKKVLDPVLVCGKKYMKNDIVDIRLQDFLNLAPSKKNDFKAFKVPVDFTSLPITLDPYVFGMWIVDATETHLSEICVYDLDILSTVLKDLEKDHMKLDFLRDNRFKIVMINESKHFEDEILKPLGIQENKFIPLNYKANNRDTRLKILAGILDCEGYLNNNCYELTIKNERVANDIIFICLSLGFYASKAEQKLKQYYRVIISGDLSVVPFKRSHIASRKQIKNILHTGFTVEKVNDTNECIKLTVDGNGRFLLSDFTVVHS